MIDMVEWMAWSDKLPKLGKTNEDKDFWREIDAAQAVANTKRTGQGRPEDVGWEE